MTWREEHGRVLGVQLSMFVWHAFVSQHMIKKKQKTKKQKQRLFLFSSVLKRTFKKKKKQSEGVNDGVKNKQH